MHVLMVCMFRVRMFMVRVGQLLLIVESQEQGRCPVEKTWQLSTLRIEFWNNLYGFGRLIEERAKIRSCL